MKIFAASDHAGRVLRKHLVQVLSSWGHEVTDLGTEESSSTDYPDYAHATAQKVLEQPGALGLLICGSGIGMSIAANRHPGIRAVVAMVEHQARMARRHNDANVLCLGERFVGQDLAVEILRAFIDEPFEGGRHALRVAKIDASAS